MNALKRILWVLLFALVLLAIPRLSGWVAGLFDYRAIDPDGAYAWISVHHIAQALIVLFIIFLTGRARPLDFGFSRGDAKAGRRYVLLFTAIFSAGSLVSHLITILTGSFQPFPYPLTTANVAGQMGFQLLLSGPSEELVFRAFAITVLSLFIRNRLLKGKVSAANLVAAAIFGLAHVNVSFAPFSVNYSLFQVAMSIVLGLFYGDCYEKTGSMRYPMMMHSISNIVMVGFTIIATLVQNPR
jgi:membrane protease YdiL (CAAX protease family)